MFSRSINTGYLKRGHVDLAGVQSWDVEKIADLLLNCQEQRWSNQKMCTLFMSVLLVMSNMQFDQIYQLIALKLNQRLNTVITFLTPGEFCTDPKVEKL